MKTFKSLETRNHTYYYGCVTKYEQTEEEKKEQHYMIFQKSVGIILLLIGLFSLLLVNSFPELGLFTIIMSILGLILILTKQHALSLWED